jgi:hypothetical protein
MCNPYNAYKSGYIERTEVSEHNWRAASSTGTPSAAETSNDVPSALDRNLTGCLPSAQHRAVFQDSTLSRWMTGSRRFEGSPKYAASQADTEP